MNENMKNYIRQRVKEAKNNYGIKYTDIAEKTGLAPQSIYMLTSSSNKLSYSTAKKIMSAVDEIEAEIRMFSYEK